MKNDWPCKCDHKFIEHDGRYLITTFRMGNFMIQGNEYIKQCPCYKYNPISNLEYLESKNETKLP
jgi:hypothetical protein